MTKPLWDTPVEERRARAMRYVGKRVRVVVDCHREKNGPTREHVGLCLAVAQPMVGTVADLLIIRSEGFRDAAISLATVRTIERV